MSYHCFPSFSAQTYVGRKRAAVDRICVGVPAGEVKSLSSFILRVIIVITVLFILLKFILFVFAQVKLNID